MAAAAFVETLIFKGATSKQTKYVRATVSDVAAASAVYPDGSSTYQLPSNENWYLVDLICVVGGTDTTNQELFVGQQSTGILIDNKSNLNTVQNRMFQLNPVGFLAGSQIRLIQRA
jgi:hypothetical protein